MAAFITGFSTAILSTLGVSGASMLGVNIHPLEWKQIIDIGLSGGFVSALAYLTRSPVPPDSNTSFITKPPQTQDPQSPK